MKKTLALLFTAAIIIAIAGCSKSPDKTPVITPKAGYPVRYYILNFDNYITQITYTDSSGNLRTTNDWTQFNGGDTTFIIHTKPFIANLSVTVSNTTSVERHYSLVIYDSLAIGKFQEMAVPPNSYSYVTSISDTIN